MPKGKPWTSEDEKRLRELVESGKDVNSIAEILGKTPEAIFMKCKRIGLEVVVTKGYTTTTSVSLPDDLPSVEEALRILAGALQSASQAD